MRKNETLKDKNDDIKSKILQAKRESKHLDFKEEFNPSFDSDWCEIIKDIVAFANSGGGVIMIGLQNNGTPSNKDVSGFLHIDSAQITDKIASYTNNQFDGFCIEEAIKDNQKIALLLPY